MELEDKISFRSIRQYVLLLKNDIQALNTIEFKTLIGWIIYSLSLVFAICTPCTIVLIITGLLSGNVSANLLIAVSFIPFMFGIPLTLLLTYINNYRRPKYLRKLMLKGISKCNWDSPIEQIGQTAYMCMKSNFGFKTIINQVKTDKGNTIDVICILTVFYNPGNTIVTKKDIEDYLEGKSCFMIQNQTAIRGFALNIFPQIDLTKDIEELLYVFNRFGLRPATFYSPEKIFEKVPSTPDVVAWTTFGDEINHIWIDWANDMLNAGFVNETMKVFANKIPTSNNQDELKALMNTLIYEFNLKVPRKYVLKNYICYIVMRENNNLISTLEAIESLSYLYKLSKDTPIFKKFYLLYKAKTALDESGKQDVWDDDKLTANNSDAYIMNYLYSLLTHDNLIELE